MSTKLDNTSDLTNKKSYIDLFSDMGLTAKDIVQNDIALALSELKQIKVNLIKQSIKTITYGFFLALSIFPLLTFAVLALGQVLDGRYWLSAFLIGAVLAVVGSVGIILAMKKIRNIDFKFSKTKAALTKEKQAVYSHVSKIQNAMKGDSRVH